jgi:hypothetical protein
MSFGQASDIPGASGFGRRFLPRSDRRDVDPNSLTQSPFAALTLVAAPALLTNASSVLALSTINRMLRTRDRMHELFNESEAGVRTEERRIHLRAVTDRVEKQAVLLLKALHAIYLALAAFASATLVTLLGTGVASFDVGIWVHVMALIGLLLGFFGAGGLVLGCTNLFHATQISLVNIRDEAALIRDRAARPARREKSG